MKYISVGIAFVLLFNTACAAIRINEIAWSGTPISANDEWIELFNDSEEIISIENWTLNAIDGSPQIILSGQIEPSGFFLLERTDDTTVPNVIADQLYTGSLSNTGEELVLQDSDGNEIGRTPSGNWATGESSPDRRSMTWTENEWKTYEGGANEEGIFGTPGRENISTSTPLPAKTFVSAEPIKVTITELAPVSIGEDEWLEIEILGVNAIDLQNWKLQRGTSQSAFSGLTFVNGGQSLSGQSVSLPETGLVGKTELNGNDFTFPEDAFVFLPDNDVTPIRFVGNPSPIGLPDDGGVLEILNQNDEVVASATWEKTKRGTKSGLEWGEIWNWDALKYWPWQSGENIPTHTRGGENKEPPAFPEQLNFHIDEIAPKRIDNIDFIELLLEDIPRNTKLPPWTLKHNGTELFAGGGEFIKKGERITLYLHSEKISDDPARYLNTTNSPNISNSKIWESSTKNGLNKTSGTLELNIWTGTSWEQTADFVCWAEAELSETEKRRLENHVDDWNGACFQNTSILQNESIARPIQSIDTNGANDFFRHFNGSPEQKNLPQNHPPAPKILVQGGRKVYETSLNLTGLDDNHATTDPDGEHDLKSWKWEINGKRCGNYEIDNWEWSATRKGEKTCAEESARSNPGIIYFNFNKQGTFTATLTVEDFSNAEESISVELDQDPFNVGGSNSAFDASVKKWLTKEFSKTEKTKKAIGYTTKVEDTFFDEFITNLDYTRIDPRFFKPTKQKKVFIPSRFRERIPLEIKTKVRKNIGLVFLY